MVASEQERLAGVGVDAAGAGQATGFLGREVRLNLLGDRPRDFGLELQDIGGIAFVLPGPDMRVSGGANQLRSDPDAPSDTLNGSLEDRIHTELAANLRHGLGRALVPHDGRARDDLQVVNLRKIGNQRVGRAVGKEVLVRIARQVL